MSETAVSLDEQVMDEIMAAEQAGLKRQGWPQKPATLECGATIGEIALALGAPYDTVKSCIRRLEGKLVYAAGARSSKGRPEIVWGMVRTARTA